MVALGREQRFILTRGMGESSAVIATLFVALCLCAAMLSACGAPPNGSSASASDAASSTSSADGLGSSAAASASSAADASASEASASESSGASTSASAAATQAAIEYWEPDSPAMSSIVEFVSASVDQSSRGYIPEEDRIAVFDMDGTLYVASGDEEENSMFYDLKPEDDLVIEGSLFVKNQLTNKATVIQQEIGKVPVLAFGNSTGGFAMANYALSNPNYPSAAFQLCCDDTERENGSESKAASMREDCEKNGYVPVSMAKDWTTIYGEGVTYLGAKEELAEAA